MDYNANPAGSMLALVDQLLAALGDQDISHVKSGWCKIDLEGVECVCRLFDALVSQLPDKVRLFCIIDCFSYYEDSD